MWALVKDGKVDTIYGGVQTITLNDIQYPKNMFTLYSTAEKKAIDIYDIVRKDQPNHNFYDVSDPAFTYDADTDTVNEAFDITEKNLTQLKKDHAASVQLQSGIKIRPYDWLASRYIFDNTKAISSAITTYTAAVRSHCVTICSAINDCSDLDAFKTVHAKIYADDGEYNTGWPDESSAVSHKRENY